MRRRLLGLVTVVACISATIASTVLAGDVKSETIQRDRNQIKGTWVIIELVANGDKAMEEDARKLTVINGSDGSWSLCSEGKEITKGTSIFDPTKSPKAIDFTPTVGDEARNVYFGIYELGENTRKMCFAPLGKGRPTEFSSTAGSGIICVTFERQKTE